MENIKNEEEKMLKELIIENKLSDHFDQGKKTNKHNKSQR